MTRGTVKLAGLLILSWVVMTTTHEFGHLVGGWLGGAKLREYDLFPWRLPYSLHAPDPNPLLTLWAGPVLGVLVPLSVATLFRREWMLFVADFCCLANGVYLALAWLVGDRLLDTPRLLAVGAWPASIVLYCIATIGVGYWRFRTDVTRVLSDASKQ